MIRHFCGASVRLSIAVACGPCFGGRYLRQSPCSHSRCRSPRAAGSSSSGVSAGAYVKSICRRSARSRRTSRAAVAPSTSPRSPAPQQGKKALQDFLTAIVADTEKAVNQLKAAGAPDVNNGKQISGAIVSAFTRGQDRAEPGQDPGRHLPTTSPDRLQGRRSDDRHRDPDVDEQHREQPLRPQEHRPRERGQEGTGLHEPRRAARPGRRVKRSPIPPTAKRRDWQ